jgi:pyridinium-3,5-bisthiocarboxylic acid mononucleotide nickel chelatase
MNTLYFDCFAGASGNMILGALVSLGVEKERLISEIEKLKIDDFAIEFTIVDRSGINSVHARTIFAEEKTHRHLSHIEKIITESDISETVKLRALEIFTNLAKAEAKVHGIGIEKVHFHEVGAMDAIIDVVGACIGFEMLGVENFIASKIHTGSGFIRMEHGKYPVPPPAVAELLKGIPVYSTEIEGELITPTGAAIIKTVCGRFGRIDDFEAEKIGYGAGTREYENFPNVLRLMLGESKTKTDTQKPKTEKLILIETNLDDISPEILGYVLEKAFEFGALDCWFTPIQMKKNRPATTVSILCEEFDREKFAGLLYTETSTLGVRYIRIERECLPREIRKVKTLFGEIDLKVAEYNGKIVNFKPEFDQMRKIADLYKKSLREVEDNILQDFKKLENEDNKKGKK